MKKQLAHALLLAPLLFIPGAALGFEEEISAMAAELASDLKQAGKSTVAVVDFTDTDGQSTQLGRFLAEEFAIALVNASAGLEVINRTHLKVIMAENDLGASGVIDSKTALSLGRITGVQVLITGTITDLGESVRVVVSALDSSTARVIRGGSGRIPKTQAIAKLLEAPAQGAPHSATRPKVPAKAAAPAGTTYGSDGVSFAFQGCRRSGSRATCHFTVTNTKEDKGVYIYATKGNNSTRLFDNLGSEYTAKAASLGSAEGSVQIRKEMIHGIAIPASFTFEGLSDVASHISVIKVKFYTDSNRSFEIRDIPFE